MTHYDNFQQFQLVENVDAFEFTTADTMEGNGNRLIFALCQDGGKLKKVTLTVADNVYGPGFSVSPQCNSFCGVLLGLTDLFLKRSPHHPELSVIVGPPDKLKDVLADTQSPIFNTLCTIAQNFIMGCYKKRILTIALPPKLAKGSDNPMREACRRSLLTLLLFAGGRAVEERIKKAGPAETLDVVLRTMQYSTDSHQLFCSFTNDSSQAVEKQFLRLLMAAVQKKGYEVTHRESAVPTIDSADLSSPPDGFNASNDDPSKKDSGLTVATNFPTAGTSGTDDSLAFFTPPEMSDLDVFFAVSPPSSTNKNFFGTHATPPASLHKEDEKNADELQSPDGPLFASEGDFVPTPKDQHVASVGADSDGQIQADLSPFLKELREPIGETAQKSFEHLSKLNRLSLGSQPPMFQYQAPEDQGKIPYYDRSDSDNRRLAVHVSEAQRALLGSATFDVLTNKAQHPSTKDKKKITRQVSEGVKFVGGDTKGATSESDSNASEKIVNDLLEVLGGITKIRQSVADQAKHCLVAYAKTDAAVREVDGLDYDTGRCMDAFEKGLQAALLEVGGKQNQFPCTNTLRLFIIPMWTELTQYLQAGAQRRTPTGVYRKLAATAKKEKEDAEKRAQFERSHSEFVKSQLDFEQQRGQHESDETRKMIIEISAKREDTTIESQKLLADANKEACKAIKDEHEKVRGDLLKGVKLGAEIRAGHRRGNSWSGSPSPSKNQQQNNNDNDGVPQESPAKHGGAYDTLDPEVLVLSWLQQPSKDMKLAFLGQLSMLGLVKLFNSLSSAEEQNKLVAILPQEQFSQIMEKLKPPKKQQVEIVMLRTAQQVALSGPATNRQQAFGETTEGGVGGGNNTDQNMLSVNSGGDTPAAAAAAAAAATSNRAGGIGGAVKQFLGKKLSPKMGRKGSGDNAAGSTTSPTAAASNGSTAGGMLTPAAAASASNTTGGGVIFSNPGKQRLEAIYRRRAHTPLFMCGADNSYYEVTPTKIDSGYYYVVGRSSGVRHNKLWIRNADE